MKYLCDSCSRLVDVREYSLRESALVVVCPECRSESRAPPPAVADRTPAPVLELARPKPPPDGPLCPKCGAPRPEERDSCARCGLVFALFNPDNLALPEGLEAQWSELERHWTETERHDAFISACAAADALTEAARRYRVHAEQNPGDALASRYRDLAADRLMTLASLPLQRGPSATSQRVRTVLAVLFLLASAGVFFLVMQQLVTRPGP